MGKKFILFISITIMLLVLLTGCSKNSSNGTDGNIKNSLSKENIPDLSIGKIAPNFTLKDLNGNNVSLEDYKGKIVLINFWTTWCKFCELEMPDLQKISSENKDVVVLTVNVQEDKDTVSNYIKKNGYTFPVVLDTKGEVATTYLVNGLPTSYFIDKDGTILGNMSGSMTYSQINSILGDIRKK